MSSRAGRVATLSAIYFAIVPFIASAGSTYLVLAHEGRLKDLFVGNELGLVLLLACANALGLFPTTLASVIGGYLYGWDCLAPLVASYLLACSIGYGLGKGLLGDIAQSWLKRRYATKLQSIFDTRFTLGNVMALRLSPIVPFAIGNVLLPVMNYRLPLILLGSGIGMLPRTLMAIWGGVQLESLSENEANPWVFALFLALSIIVFMLPRWWARKKPAP